MDDSIRILGGGTVSHHGDWGASCVLVTVDGINIVVDCGVRPRNAFNYLPDIEFLEGKRIDAVIFTHVHADHIGAGPALALRHPEAKIYMTFETFDLAGFQLAEQIRIAETDIRIPKIFSNRAYEEFLERSLVLHFGDWVTIKGGDRQIQFALWQAGHIRGSASVLIKGSKSKLVISGDFSTHDMPTVERAQPLPDEFADGRAVLVTEATTCGADLPDPASEAERLVAATKEVLAADGNVLIPSFSIGRAQDVCLILANSGVKPWLGGGARAVLRSDAFGPEFFHGNIREVPSLEALIEYQKPKVVITTSGMMEFGQSRRLAREWLDDPKNGIFIPGYQAPGTLGCALLNAKEEDPIEVESEEGEIGPEMRVLRARVEKFNLSAHSDGPETANLIASLNPAKTIVVHAQNYAFLGLKEFLKSAGYTKPVYPGRNGYEFQL